MGNTTVWLWAFEVKRDVIKNSVLQKHWERKGKAPTQGPLLDCQVQGYGYTSKLWSRCQEAFGVCYHSCYHNCLFTLKAGFWPWILGPGLPDCLHTVSLPSCHNSWKMAGMNLTQVLLIVHFASFPESWTQESFKHAGFSFSISKARREVYWMIREV